MDRPLPLPHLDSAIRRRLRARNRIKMDEANSDINTACVSNRRTVQILLVRWNWCFGSFDKALVVPHYIFLFFPMVASDRFIKCNRNLNKLNAASRPICAHNTAFRRHLAPSGCQAPSIKVIKFYSKRPFRTLLDYIYNLPVVIHSCPLDLTNARPWVHHHM